MTSDNKGLHRFFREWRKCYGLTLEQIALRVGRDVATISRWERGAVAVTLENLQELAAAYGVSPIALLMSPTDHALARKLSDAHMILAGMSDHDRDAWLTIGKSLTAPKE